MKTKQTKTGIWMDGREAIIIDIVDHKTTERNIQSNVTFQQPHGGYGGSDKHLAQDARPDDKYLRRQKQEMAVYFKEVIAATRESDALVVMGPGEVKVLFAKAAQVDNTATKPEKVLVEDRMTKNQLVAKVKTYFGETTRITTSS